MRKLFLTLFLFSGLSFSAYADSISFANDQTIPTALNNFKGISNDGDTVTVSSHTGQLMQSIHGLSIDGSGIYGDNSVNISIREQLTANVSLPPQQPYQYIFTFSDNIMAENVTFTGFNPCFVTCAKSKNLPTTQFDENSIGFVSFYTYFTLIFSDITDDVDTALLTGRWDTPPSTVPLPAALPLYGAGMGLMGFLAWRKRRKSA